MISVVKCTDWSSVGNYLDKFCGFSTFIVYQYICITIDLHNGQDSGIKSLKALEKIFANTDWYSPTGGSR